MSTQNQVVGQRVGVSPEHVWGAAPLLCVLFVLSWSLDPELFGSGADSILAPIRWIIVVLMCLAVPFISSQGVARGWSIILFVSVLALTIFLNGTIQVSFPIFARILGAAVLAIFAGALSFSERVKVVRSVLVVSVAIVLGSLLLSVIAPERAFQSSGFDRPRLYGLTFHPAIVGYFASLVATVFGSAALFTRQKASRRLRDGGLLLFGVVAILLADSRTGEVALPLSLFCEFVIFRLLYSRALRRSIVFPWLVFASAIVIFISLPILVASRVIPVSIGEDQYSASTQARVAIWELGISDFENNMMLGNGIGTKFIADNPNADKDLLLYYHSVLINYLAKAGIVGGLGILALLLAAPYACLSFARRIVQQKCLNEDDAILLRFAVGSCVVTVAFATIEAALQNIYPTFLIFFLSITLPSRSLQ